MQVMGHKSLSASARYVHSNASDKVRARRLPLRRDTAQLHPLSASSLPGHPAAVARAVGRMGN
jgi:hypothetical protein